MVPAGFCWELGGWVRADPTSERVVLTLKLTRITLLVGKLRGNRHSLRNRVGLLIVAGCLSACARHTVSSVTTPAIDAVLGVPVYPGAAADAGGSFTTASGTSVAAFQTADSYPQVVAFYRRRLPPGSQTMSASTADGSAATFEYARGTFHVTVEVASSKPAETDVLIKRARTPRRAGT
jgi:hypothetical protein